LLAFSDAEFDFVLMTSAYPIQSYHIISYHIVDLKRHNRLKVGTNKTKLKVKMQSAVRNEDVT